MKKRSEVVESNETPGLAGCVARTEGRAGVLDSTLSTRREHAQPARPGDLLVSAAAVVCS